MAKFPFDIVGFDLDGTLLDTHEDLAAAVNYALELAGRPAVASIEVRALIGGGGKTMLRRALELTGGVPEDFDTLHSHFLNYYEANVAVHTQLFPGTEAMLDDLAAAGVMLAVVTNKLEALARKGFDALGLTGRFFTIIGGDTLGSGRAKPAPDGLLEMIGRAGGGRSAFVGDTTYDVKAAKAASIPSVAVSFGFNDVQADMLGADAVIARFDELIPTLRMLQSPA